MDWEGKSAISSSLDMTGSGLSCRFIIEERGCLLFPSSLPGCSLGFSFFFFFFLVFENKDETRGNSGSWRTKLRLKNKAETREIDSTAELENKVETGKQS